MAEVRVVRGRAGAVSDSEVVRRAVRLLRQLTDPDFGDLEVVDKAGNRSKVLIVL